MERTGAWSARLVELMCCMDERDKVQKKTFTKWMNQHLKKVRKHVNDLYEDLRDGHNLISLLEVLSGDTLPREEGRMRFHRLHNVQVALDYLKKHQVKLVNIRNDDITDGNPRLTLGLIWTIILHFQISNIHVTGESEDMSAKERLLLWSQQAAQGYAGMGCENFTTCWSNGRLFNAIIHKYRPDLIDMNSVAVQSNHANLEHAFFAAEKLGVARLLDPEDVDVSSPDEKSVITYVSSVHDAFLEGPADGEGIQTSLRSLTCFTCYVTKSASQLKKKLEQEVEITFANKKANTTIKDLKYKLNETELQKSSTEEVSSVFKGKIDQVNSELKSLKLKLEEKEQAEQRYLQQLKDLGKQLCKVIDNAEEVMQENIDLKKINMNYEEKLKEKAQLKREVEELTLFQREAKITIKHLNSQISSLLKEKMEAERSTEACKEAANNHQDQCKKIQEQLLKNPK